MDAVSQVALAALVASLMVTSAAAKPPRGLPAASPSNPGQIRWVALQGGAFMMGAEGGDPDEGPVRQVNVAPFEISKTEVTVAQYALCVKAGKCRPPSYMWFSMSSFDRGRCNWEVEGVENHPVNCVDRKQAIEFAAWAGGRLPTEAEWEYAARGGNKARNYPWGDQEANCDLAVMEGKRGPGCGKLTTAPVCSRAGGNTAAGLCDMAGNVWEWVEDAYHPSYQGAPTDSTAWNGDLWYGVIRGGGWASAARGVRTTNRGQMDVGAERMRWDLETGIRLARSLPDAKRAKSTFRAADWVEIRPGSFAMGSADGETGRLKPELRHSVSISRPFLLKKTEVTQGEWRRLLGTNPSRFPQCGDSCPIDMVNWIEAAEYMNALSTSEGLTKCYDLGGCSGKLGGGCPDDNDCTGDRWCSTIRFVGLECSGYRFPTEAEWEYAARAGTETSTYAGDVAIIG